jgi:hypothetical protein
MLASYRAFEVGRRLAVRLYRYRAFTVGAIAAYFVFGLLVGNFYGSQIPTFPLALFSVSLIIPTLFWLDATVRVARRSDPYERDSLHWTKLRYLLVAGLVVATGVVLAKAPIVLIIGVGVGIPTAAPIEYQVLGFSIYGVSLFVSAVLLVISALRSKDKTLQNQLKWFALYPASVLVGLVQFGLINYLFSSSPADSQLKILAIFVIYILIAFGGFCLYKSTKSLASTTNRLETGV